MKRGAPSRLLQNGFSLYDFYFALLYPKPKQALRGLAEATVAAMRAAKKKTDLMNSVPGDDGKHMVYLWVSAIHSKIVHAAKERALALTRNGAKHRARNQKNQFRPTLSKIPTVFHPKLTASRRGRWPLMKVLRTKATLGCSDETLESILRDEQRLFAVKAVRADMVTPPFADEVKELQSEALDGASRGCEEDIKFLERMAKAARDSKTGPPSGHWITEFLDKLELFILELWDGGGSVLPYGLPPLLFWSIPAVRELILRTNEGPSERTPSCVALRKLYGRLMLNPVQPPLITELLRVDKSKLSERARRILRQKNCDNELSEYARRILRILRQEKV